MSGPHLIDIGLPRGNGPINDRSLDGLVPGKPAPRGLRFVLSLSFGAQVLERADGNKSRLGATQLMLKLTN